MDKPGHPSPLKQPTETEDAEGRRQQRSPYKLAVILAGVQFGLLLAAVLYAWIASIGLVGPSVVPLYYIIVLHGMNFPFSHAIANSGLSVYIVPLFVAVWFCYGVILQNLRNLREPYAWRRVAAGLGILFLLYFVSAV